MVNEVASVNRRRKVRKTISLLVEISFAVVSLKSRWMDLGTNLRELDDEVERFRVELKQKLAYHEPHRAIPESQLLHLEKQSADLSGNEILQWSVQAFTG